MAGYAYSRKPRSELKRIADIILQKNPGRRRGFAIDIEGIVEDYGITIVPRPISKLPVDGYVARDHRYIVINELQFRMPSRVRFTVSEEFAHLILEFQLWEGGVIPKGAFCNQLDPDTWRAIESDAKRLAAEILQPQEVFKSRFTVHRSGLSGAGMDDETATKVAIRKTAADLEVSNLSASYRARDLRLITSKMRDRIFPLLF